jgi:ribosomal protein S18 acetylase RimI-like enzyme
VERAFSIRSLQLSDSIGSITLLLHRAYSRLSSMGLNYTAVDQTDNVTVQRLSQGQAFVAVNDKLLANPKSAATPQIIGTVVVTAPDINSPCDYYQRQGVAALHQFAVDPDFQSQGVGLALMKACEQWASEQGFREIALDTAQPAQHLVSWYQKLGYQIVDSVQWQGKVYASHVFSKQLNMP